MIKLKGKLLNKSQEKSRLIKKINLLLVLMVLVQLGPLNFFVSTTEQLDLVNAEGMNPFNVQNRLSAGYSHSVLLKDDGTVVTIGNNSYRQRNVSGWKDIIAVAAGMDHTVGLKSDGTVVAVGYNCCGQLNVSDWKDIVAVAAGMDHTVGLKSDGTVVAVGDNSYRQRNVSGWKDIVAIAAGGDHTVGLKSDGTVVAVGGNYSGQCNVSGWKDIVAIASGFFYTVGLKSDGTVVAVGDKSHGQLDVSGWKDIVAIAGGSHYTVGLKSDGTVVAVGDNNYGQCNVSGWKDIVAVAAGGFHTVGLKNDGTVVAVGDNSSGQLNVSVWKDIIAISGGDTRTVGLKNDGTVVAVGDYSYVLSNLNGWKDIIAIAGGGTQTFGLKSDGTVVAVGSNRYGQLDVSGWKDIVAIAGGMYHTVGLKSDGTVVAVGYNSSGQNNVSNWKDIVAIAAGDDHTVGLKSDGTVVAVGDSVSRQLNVSSWKNIVGIAASDYYIVGLKSDGTVVAVGSSSSGQRNVSDWKDIVAIATGSNHTVGLKKDGTVVAVGNNTFGQLNVSGWKDIVAIAGGEYHTVGLKSDGTVVAVGDNSNGKLETNNNFSLDIKNFVEFDKKVVKPNEKIMITLNKNSLNTISNPSISLAGGSQLTATEMKQIDTNTYKFEYQVPPTDSGIVNVAFKGAKDVIGRDLSKNEVFRVIPLHSIQSSKTSVKSGDQITLTATFTESVTPGFKIALAGATSLGKVTMNEIAGSGGKKFSTSVTVPASEINGAVNAVLTNVTTTAGVNFASYTENNVFTLSKRSMPIKSLIASKTKLKVGDNVQFTAEFTEPIKSGIKLSLNGAINDSSIVMTEVPGSKGYKYSLSYNVPSGSDGIVNATLSNVYDYSGYLCENFSKNNVFEVDTPVVQQITSDDKIYSTGDLAYIEVTFNKPVNPGVKIKLSGAIKDELFTMDQVQGSNGTKYSIYYEVKENQVGYVNVELSNIVDTFGNTLNKYTATNVIGLNMILVSGITVASNKVTITRDATVALKATIRPIDATYKNVTWKSSNNNVATVDQNGKVKGVSAGQATITVTTLDGNYVATSTVTVEKSPALTPTFGTVTKTTNGFSVKINNYSSQFIWSVTTTSGKVNISSSGLITVTGLSNGKTATVSVTTSRTGYNSGSAKITSKGK